ncbi:MAG TPA: hypothetical protein VIX89_11155 [Bryobacteraceae bacterium]
MPSIRQVLLSTVVFAILPCAVVKGASSAVEYIGGTAKSIPINASGSISVSDAKELRFNYGQSVYKIPYSQITGTNVVQGEGRHILGKIPVPTMFPGRRKQTLAINFKDPAGTSGTLNFELTASEATAVREGIAEKQTTAQSAAAQQGPEEWWGDKYWKTKRNQAMHDAATAGSAPATPATVASGTK